MITIIRKIYIGFDDDEVLPDTKYTGGHLQECFDMSYKDLKRRLGMPNSICDGYKTDAEWEIITPKGIGCIYNYKDGKNYNGADGTPLTQLRDWHIGADNNEVAQIILKELNLWIKKQ